MKTEISYQIPPGDLHKVTVIIKNREERIQARWLHGCFYETQRHGMLNFAYRKFRGGTFIDVGAAIGNHSLFFAKCCNADKVYAFEPVPALFDHLVQNIEANGIANIAARNIALGERAMQVGLLPSNVAPEKGGMLMTRIDESGSGVRMERLDDVLREEGLQEVKCIKIDVEGYSLPVLRGARETIATHHPAIFCECETKEHLEEVNAYLTELGYAVWKINGQPFAMNHSPTYLWEFQQAVDITVLITTYNRPDELRRLLAELITDARGLKVHCKVYNDSSDLPYEGMPTGNEAFKLEQIDVRPHHGKREHWKLINRIFGDLRSARSRFYLQLPDDVRVLPGFLKHALDTYQAITDPNKICLNLYLDDSRIGRTCWTSILPRICRFGETSVFKTGWVDMCYLADGRFFQELDYEIKPIPANRWKSNPKLSSGVGQQISGRLRRFSMYQVRDCFISSAPVPSRMHPDRPINEDLSTAQLDPIVCGIASIPERLENLRQTIVSVLPFVDEMHVFLNNYPTVPCFLRDSKISVYRSQDHGDLGDAGKFFTIGQKRGFYLAIDDDIIYPEDYVWNLVNEIRRNRRAGRRVAVGLHGKIMRERVEHYYRGHTRQFHCASALSQERGVHVLGTGTVAFHTDDLPITINDFKGPKNMADIYFSIACQKYDVGCVALPRPANYLKIQRIPVSKTIWGYYHKNDQVQSDLYNSWKEWRIRA